MLKASAKRRRTKAEVKEEAKQNFGDPRVLNEKLKRMAELEAQLA